MTNVDKSHQIFTSFQVDTTADVADEQELIARLDGLQPGKKQQKHELFLSLYPGIERPISRRVPLKAIVTELEAMGSKLSLGGFRALLDAERERRSGEGECPRCPQCGSSLPIEVTDTNLPIPAGH